MNSSKLDVALSAAAELRPATGFVAMASAPGVQPYLGAFGRRGTDAEDAMATDSIFWIASFTKLVTSIVALQLIEDGALALDQTVASILPDFADLPILEGFDGTGAPRLREATDAPTIRHLLTHTSGCGYAFMDLDLARWAEHSGAGIAEARAQPRLFDAGARWQYGVSSEWLGTAIEAVTGEDLEVVFRRRVFGPLAMEDTTLDPDPSRKQRIAQLHARAPDGALTPMELPLPPPPHFSSGGGGLYSTAPDFMRLLRALLDGDILSAESRSMLFSNEVGELDSGVTGSAIAAFARPFEPMPGQPKRWSLGMMINPEPVAGGRAAGSGAWAGLANCYYWADPTNGVAGILMSQVLPFADPQILDLFSTFERTVYV
jgi:CubicO group peptidase (beta-lactamase class C family)